MYYFILSTLNRRHVLLYLNRNKVFWDQIRYSRRDSNTNIFSLPLTSKGSCLLCTPVNNYMFAIENTFER
jgi:hypothetical protein